MFHVKLNIFGETVGNIVKIFQIAMEACRRGLDGESHGNARTSTMVPECKYCPGMNLSGTDPFKNNYLKI